MKKWVESQAAKRGFDTNAYFLDILMREKEIDVRERIDQILMEALSSGEPTPVTNETWERIRSNGRKLAKERRRK